MVILNALTDLFLTYFKISVLSAFIALVATFSKYCNSAFLIVVLVAPPFGMVANYRKLSIQLVLRGTAGCHIVSVPNVRNPNHSFSIQLRTFYEYSHLDIHTIFILNCKGIIFECWGEHSWTVTWMLLCPLG